MDSSVLIAILRQEPGADAFAALLGAQPDLRVSAATLLETSIVAKPSRYGDLDQILEDAGVDVVPFDRAQAEVAREAYVRYGKGSGSAARLNFGDCMAYALAKTTGEPLLFKGEDFTHTDVTPAL